MIEVKNVTMDFRFGDQKVGSLKEFVVRMLKGQFKYKKFRALENVSFHISKGEVVGFIGHNGAGKSTMLKLVSGLYRPSEGTVKTHGGIVPLLELGAGFDYDLNGGENIYLNGALLGYSKKQIQDNYDSIVEYSGLQEFIDMPLRNYSSGMIMRLAFAISSILTPDILILDEILSVGDESFQRKSHDRIIELIHSGCTVVFVSHSIEQVRELCTRVIWLDHGHVKMDGEPNIVCEEYLKTFN